MEQFALTEEHLQEVASDDLSNNEPVSIGVSTQTRSEEPLEQLTLTEEHLQKVTGGDVSNGAAGGLAAIGFAGGLIEGAALATGALLLRKPRATGAAAHAAPAATHSMPVPVAMPTSPIQRPPVGPRFGSDGKKTVQWSDQGAGPSGT